jgi:hypothetical protein
MPSARGHDVYPVRPVASDLVAIQATAGPAANVSLVVAREAKYGEISSLVVPGISVEVMELD